MQRIFIKDRVHQRTFCLLEFFVEHFVLLEDCCCPLAIQMKTVHLSKKKKFNKVENVKIYWAKCFASQKFYCPKSSKIFFNS